MTKAQTSAPLPLVANDTLLKLQNSKFSRQYFLLDEFIDFLVWSIIRISFDSKCLVDGINGRVLKPNDGWDSGVIRLLPILRFKSKQINFLIDCVTQRSPNFLLPDQAVIQSDSHLLYREPHQVGDILLEFKDNLRTLSRPTFELVQPVRNGPHNIWFLEPGKEWDFAKVRLYLAIGFFPNRIAALPPSHSVPPLVEEIRSVETPRSNPKSGRGFFRDLFTKGSSNAP